jgi:hypothetical protein
VADALGADGMTGRTSPRFGAEPETDDGTGRSHDTVTDRRLSDAYEAVADRRASGADEAVTDLRAKGGRAAMPIRAYRWFRTERAFSVIGVRAVTALTLVVLTGCSPSAAQPFTPIDLPADAGSQASPQPSSQQAVSTPRVETVQVAPGVRMVVEWPAAPDQDTTEMINAFRDLQGGMFKAVVTGGRDVAYLGIVEDKAVKDANSWVQAFLDQRRSVRGTVRLYALDAGPVNGSGAELKVCMDESGMRLLYSVTGKAVPSQPVWTRKPFFQSAGMRRGDDGVWRIALLRNAELPNERAKGCLR